MRTGSYAYLAYQLLKETGHPMRYKEIAKEVLKRKTTKGKTPENTLRAELGRRKEFKRIGVGVYSLSEW